MYCEILFSWDQQPVAATMMHSHLFWHSCSELLLKCWSCSDVNINLNIDTKSNGGIRSERHVQNIKVQARDYSQPHVVCACAKFEASADYKHREVFERMRGGCRMMRAFWDLLFSLTSRKKVHWRRDQISSKYHRDFFFFFFLIQC